MTENIPEFKKICKTYNLLTNALNVKINSKEYNELKQQMSHDELDALKVLQKARNATNYQTKRASGTNKKRENKITPPEDSHQENKLIEPKQLEHNQEHLQTEQKEEHTNTTEQIQSESNLTVLEEVVNNTIELEHNEEKQTFGCTELNEHINQ